MKKIINGKMYNTETAEFIADYNSPHFQNDLNFYEETLYLKKTGEYFLFGKGNPGSPYNERTRCNSWTGSCEIIPISLERAKKWVERNLSADDFQELFGTVEE